MISDLIELIVRVCPEQSEAKSTEDLMREIEETNLKIKSKGGDDIVVAIMDVSALYPILDQEKSARILLEEFEASGLEVEGVNLR